ncbi:PREDICTED: uncharacterized protein LOC106344874 [Brassica oleracea var. oleracea]|uniref:uncharacterized protein LOC106344874 n=1 Tax=Brassica oleracea var. oleracea TaxID=109376 RepID=UPI0006A72C23|nr:PREDICTED: uncharacterized protein LOC106344874 [Brassica oleracea var. oleracea]
MGGLTSCNDSVRSIRAHQRRGDITNRLNVWSQKETKTFGAPITSDDTTTFTDADAEGVNFPHNDPLVVEIMVADCEVPRILVDTGSSVNLIFQENLQKMELRGYKHKPKTRQLTSFAGETTMSVGTIKLPVHPGGITKITTFTIIDKPAVYNIILGTPWLHDMEAVLSSYHQCLKFPTSLGTHVLKGSQGIARACSIMGPEEMRVRRACNAVISEIPTEQTRTGEPPREAIEQFPIDDNNPERRVGIGSELSPDIRAELIDFLKENFSTFAWKTTDMIGIDPSIICHELNVNPTYNPVKQKRRKLGPERAAAVNAEEERLTNAGSIREVRYPEWLANPVVVKKKNGSWRVCVDFTDLNKACPKDSFPLPHIDRIVEATAGNELLSLMDTFAGYNQILMHPEDQEKTSFITERGTYCYKVMPFGLKNARATYQRLVNEMFSEQLGNTMEVYIDDMLVKTFRAKSHVNDLRKCFAILNEYEAEPGEMHLRGDIWRIPGIHRNQKRHRS